MIGLGSDKFLCSVWGFVFVFVDFFPLNHNLVKSRVEVALVDRGLLLLNSLLAEHQPDFHVRVWQWWLWCFNEENNLLFNFDGTPIKCLTPDSQVLDDGNHIKRRFDKFSFTWFSVDIFCFQVSRLHNLDISHILQSPTFLFWYCPSGEWIYWFYWIRVCYKILQFWAWRKENYAHFCSTNMTLKIFRHHTLPQCSILFAFPTFDWKGFNTFSTAMVRVLLEGW